jgi:hypothetical protein
VCASIGQTHVYTPKTGRIVDQTERSPPNGDRSAKQSQKPEAAALAVEGK